MKVECLNLKERTDRRSHIEQEFAAVPAFELSIFSAIKKERGALGIWLSLQEIARRYKDENAPFFILCQDDHVFTPEFNFNNFCDQIDYCKSLDADLLIGGVSSFSNALQIDEHLFWVDHFNGLQFVVIYEKIYDIILNTEFNDEDEAADIKLSLLCGSKFCVFPFISLQVEFGYSDVTQRNAQKGVVDNLFREFSKAMGILVKVKKYYSNKIG